MTHASVSREDFMVARRWSLTAATWFEKIVVRLQWLHEHARGERRWLASYDSACLLTSVLGNAERLVPLLDEHQVREVLERAEAVVSSLKRHRLAAKLEQVDGRTGPEAHAFIAKAAALREGS